MRPRAINKVAADVFNVLACFLPEDGDSHTVDNAGRGIMPVHIERLDARRVSVAHYYKNEGDLMSDPEVVFFENDNGDVFPISFEQANMGVRAKYAVEFADNFNELVSVSPGQDSIAEFCNEWLVNIANQQQLDVSRKVATSC